MAGVTRPLRYTLRVAGGGSVIDSITLTGGRVDQSAAGAAAVRATAGGISRGEAYRFRLRSWLLLGVVVLIYTVVFFSALTGMARLMPLELLYCTPIFATVYFGVAIARKTEGSERTFWAMLASANGVLLACEALLIVWVWVIDKAGPPPVSWPFHVLHVAAAGFFIGMLSAMRRRRSGSPAMHVRWALDLAIMSVVASVVVFTIYVWPTMHAKGAPWPHVLVGLAYPLMGIVMLAGTLGNVVGYRASRWRTWDTLIAVSLGLYAIGIGLWPSWYSSIQTTSRTFERGMLDVLQLSGHWILMMAAVYRFSDPGLPSVIPLPPAALSRSPWRAAIVPTMAAVTVLVVPFITGGAAGDPLRHGVLVGASVAIVVLLAARSYARSLEYGALVEQTISDPLTRVRTHRFFLERLEQEIAQARRFEDELSVVIVDLDAFASYNKTHGLEAGDRLLVQVAQLLQAASQRDWTVSRLGGDQFALIVPRAGSLDAVVHARRLLDVISIEAGVSPGQVTASAGVAVFPRNGESASDIVKVAEAALFEAKSVGGAHLFIYHDDQVGDHSARARIARLESERKIAAATALAAAVDARDRVTQDHSRNVAVLARRIAEHIGLSSEQAWRAETAGLVHDVGKIGIADAILNKPGPLDDVEREQVREHAAMGQRILAAAGLGEILPAVRSHHEWWNGQGYPDGLAATEIPMEARILAVCDAYDAMISDRPHRSAYTRESALAEIERAAGTHYDPELVAALRAILLADAAAHEAFRADHRTTASA